MRSITAAIPLVLGLALLPHGDAVGGVPTPWTCFVSSPLLACPAGDLNLRVIVRRFEFIEPYSTVRVDFSQCSGVQFPPVLGDEGYDVTIDQGGVSLWNVPPTGQADLMIRAGGPCAVVSVYGGGMLLATRALASPDQDGNLAVGAEDLALAQAKVGTSDLTADFDGDGAVTSADVQFLSGHLGHHAPGMVTPAATRSWAAIKLLYR